MNNDITFFHVKGHAEQDPNFEYDRAPQQTQRNIDMDKNAQIVMQQPPTQFKPTNSTMYFPNQKNSTTGP